LSSFSASASASTFTLTASPPPRHRLDYDMWTCQVNDKVLFGNGRWFLGPGHSFIIFPKATRSVLMLSRTADSSTISVSHTGPQPQTSDPDP